jgi:2-C-methyl-D-erythritol 4-phosphate cytidylyltransferase
VKSILVMLAAGQGSRFSHTTPKIFANLHGKPVIQRTLETVIASGLIDEIVIVVSEQNHYELERVVLGLVKSHEIRIVLGGSSRSESSLKALEIITDHEAKVLIHDGVRPFITRRIIQDCLNALDSYKACDVAITSADTIIEHENGILKSIPVRSRLRRGQTPQGFMLSKIRSAYQEISRFETQLDFSDDCSVFMKQFPDEEVYIVDGEDRNIKITTFSDLIHAESIMGMESYLTLNSEELSDLEIQGKSAVVFGGSSGIGLALYLELEQMGIPAMVASRSLTQTDVCNPEDVRSFLSKASEAVGPISLVFNCAGEIAAGGLSELNYHQIESTIRTNIIGATTVIRESIPFMTQSNGCITLLSSSSATYGRENQTIYAATKAAVESITQSFSDQSHHSGVRVNALRPARTATAKRLMIFGGEDPNSLLCPRFVARALIRASLFGASGKVFPLSVLDQGDYVSSCLECQNQKHD